MSFEGWSRLLAVAMGIQVPLGLSVAMGYQTPLWAWHRQRMAAALWDLPDLPADAIAIADQLGAMLGATMACWGLSMVWVVVGPFRRREPWAWACVASSTTLWFTVDTTLSASNGVWVNVAFNVAALVMIGGPLVATGSAFRSSVP